MICDSLIANQLWRTTVNLGVGLAIGYGSSGGEGPTSIDRTRGVIYFENATGVFARGVSVGGVITAGAGQLGLPARQNGTIRDHELSHAGRQSSALGWAFLPAILASYAVGGSFGVVSTLDLSAFDYGTHAYSPFERWWNDAPDW